MRAIWVDAGNDADYAKLKSLGITEPFYDIRDPRVTLPYLQAVRQRGFTPGVYAVADWWPLLDGAAFATKVSALLQACAPGTPPDFPAVCLDIEGMADLRGYTVAALTQWRKHRPKRVTDLTIEGHKGGLFTAAAALTCAMAIRYVVPQCYNGAMTEVWDTYAMATDLSDAGFPLSSIRPFYDAAHLPEWWDGYAFTQGRLP